MAERAFKNAKVQFIECPTKQKIYHVDRIPDFVAPMLADIAVKEGITKFQVEQAPFHNGDDGAFDGTMFKVCVKGTKFAIETIEDFELRLIVKLPPADDIRRQNMGGMLMFRREVFVYNTLLPAFERVQRDKGIVENDKGFFSYPKVYAARYDEDLNEAVIVMEDLTFRGFSVWNKYRPINFSHAHRLMTELGRFHAVSFAMKEHCSAEFEQFKGLTDIMSNSVTAEQWQTMNDLCCDRAIQSLDEHETGKRKRVETLKQNMWNELQKAIDGQMAEPYSVITHGDCWTNNIMYSYKSGAAENIALLDWQITRYSSPVLDILYFIFTCTEKAMRASHFDGLIAVYYKSLREHLERMGGDANLIFPFTALLRQLKVYGKYGLAMAIFIIPTLCSDPEVENSEFVSSDSLLLNDDDDDDDGDAELSKRERVYNKRMGDIIRDVVRYGYI